LESLFDELKRYVSFGPADEQALRSLHACVAPAFPRIAQVFYDRILAHAEARRALQGGESQVGRLKTALVGWMERLFEGPWDEDYLERRSRIGRVHVRIALPQHYMFAAMNVLRGELELLIDECHAGEPGELAPARAALGKILDLELAIMLHTYRQDLLAQQDERLASFDQLAGTIGHELRNPLGVIETSLYILKGRLVDDELATKHLDRIGEQVSISNQIVDTLLNLIRERPLVRRPVRLADVLAEACRAVAVPDGVRLLANGLDDLPELQADAAQIRQVLVNLLENALQAVGSQGQVRVIGTRRHEAVELAVEDSGPGVDASIRHRLFEPLVTTKHGGIGLGLAFVRRILERHDGSVSYEGVPGQGARFVLRLPLKGADA